MAGSSYRSSRLLAFTLLLSAAFAFSPSSFAQGSSNSSATTASAKTANPAPNSKIQQLITELGRTRSFSGTALSPDGKQIAWAVRGVAHETGKDSASGMEVYVADANGEHARRMTAAATGSKEACQEDGLAWSPDSRQLAFLSNCGDSKQSEIYLAEAGQASAKPRQLTHLHGEVDALSWAPDGKKIGFLYVPDATRHAGALAAMKPPSGVIGVEGLEIQHVAAADIAGGTVQTLTPANLHVYEFDWSPDSAKFAYIAAPPPGENTWWVAQLYTQTAQAGAQPQSILNPGTETGPLHGLQIAVPRWSPDGSQIALIGGLMSDQGATGGDIYLVPASGGPPKNVTEGQRVSSTWFAWIGPEELAVSSVAGGSSEIGQLHLNAAARGIVFKLPASIGDGRLEMSLSLAKDGAFAAIKSSDTMPPEVYTGQLTPGSSLKQITHLNDGLKPSWGKYESVEWTNDSFHVQGWLQYPAHYDPAKKYPMIVMVHGGPSSAVTPRWPGVGFGGAPFSALDYFVLYPNPRGSYGQGERFTKANIKDFGYGDLRDILAGVGTVEKKFPVDDARLGLTGWSYGGFMTMFGVTQTNRFHAAVAGAGISDWQSYYGENSIDQWMIPFFGASVYDDPSIYAKSSAIDFIKQVKTPTLVVVGDRDGECPAPQSFEFWHALRAEGVPTRLVVYPDEGHAFASPEHRRDVLERALAWFDQYLGEAASSI